MNAALPLSGPRESAQDLADDADILWRLVTLAAGPGWTGSAASAPPDLPRRLGLEPAAFAELAALLGCGPWPVGAAMAAEADPAEAAIAALLEGALQSPSPLGRFLPAILARRAQEPNHLWQDLGLASREELGWLMHRHFPFMAWRNRHGMRWKKFLARALCAEGGAVVCVAPVCAACDEFDACFAPESGTPLAPSGS